MAMMAADSEPAVEDLRAGGEEMMRYFLIGPKTGKTPAAGFKLLLVLPGGDGSEEFRPFITNILNEALGEQYLVAELVAPKWRENPEVVWPTEKLRDEKAKFTTEKFIDSVVDDVKKKQKIDEKHVYALAWSSSGPAVYAAALREKTPIVGAFVAMSVFKPDQCPPAKNAKGRAFYILHSPQDFIAMSFPNNAKATLSRAEARVKLETYKGGHGWHGDVFGMIRSGMKWLEQQPRISAPARSTSAPAEVGKGG